MASSSELCFVLIILSPNSPNNSNNKPKIPIINQAKIKINKQSHINNNLLQPKGLVLGGEGTREQGRL